MGNKIEATLNLADELAKKTATLTFRFIRENPVTSIGLGIGYGSVAGLLSKVHGGEVSLVMALIFTSLLGHEYSICWNVSRGVQD